ncbi:MAG: type II toxin-antitoxin system RatA family toxin [Gammaproteobacteria bacterium]|nr:type II toxin-antitoxin system RatA family toxin [Gammaproteobacteria bacterium]
MTIIKRELIVPYSDKQMFDLVNDIKRYPEFLNWCSQARLIKESQAHQDEIYQDYIEAELTISYSGVLKQFTTRNSLVPNSKIIMSLVEGPFKHLHGVWEFKIIDNSGNLGCKVEFSLDFEFSNYFVSMMFGKVFQEIAEKIVGSFSARAKQVYG